MKMFWKSNRNTYCNTKSAKRNVKIFAEKINVRKCMGCIKYGWTSDTITGVGQ